jgi:hypothetical protein
MRVWQGAGLLQTAHYEQVIQSGQRWSRAVALSIMGRQEEALMIATELAGEGRIGRLFTQLDRTGQHQQLIEFVESHWPDLAAFESEYPHDGIGYSNMLRIARAYSAAGNEIRFNDAMARVRMAHDRSLEQGITSFDFLADEARYHVLSGDRERALELLAQAVDAGMVFGVEFAWRWPEMEIFTGEPRYEAIQARMWEHLNSERAELGLDPVTS